MITHEQQDIEVVPGSLKNLMVEVATGRYRIPQFQRKFVWEQSKVIKLFDSIYREYPIGTFFLWKADRKHNKLFRHAVGLDLPPVKADDDITFILDGQQRITSLYAAIQGLTLNGRDYSKICFDLEEEKFVSRNSDNKRYVSVCDIWGEGFGVILRNIEERYFQVLNRCHQTLRGYPISLVVVKSKDLAAVCTIFQRINQSGKRLDRFDLISAMTFRTDFNLRKKFESEVIAKLEKTMFGKIKPTMVTQLMALVKSGSCTESHEFELSADDIKSIWNQVVDSVFLAADTLRKEMGVINSGYLPYNAIMTLLAYYFFKSGNRSLPSEHAQWIRRWFWRASFAKHYGGGGATKVGNDRQLFDQLISGEEPNFRPPADLSVESLIRTKMKTTSSAIRNAYLCLLAAKNPVHWENNIKLDLVHGGISDFTSREKHHIFPRAYLDREGHAGAEIHALPNFCFLPAELNNRIRDSEPAVYFMELQTENPRFNEALSSHLIPFGPESGALDNDYLKFLQVRGKLILEEINHLCGILTSPREHERPEAIKRLEHRIRDYIHRTLGEHKGKDYWRSEVPQQIRDEVERRIASDLKKYPDLKPQDFNSPRARLNKCNVMEYLPMVEKRDNWEFFKEVFINRDQLKHHMISFSDYRNHVMHSDEPMNELKLKSGEAALIWFENVLPSDEEPNDIEEEA